MEAVICLCCLTTQQHRPLPSLFMYDGENCLLSCAGSNKQPVSSEVGGRRSGGGGVSALFSSPGADKELFDRAERNESDLGQLI